MKTVWGKGLCIIGISAALIGCGKTKAPALLQEDGSLNFDAVYCMNKDLTLYPGTDTNMTAAIKEWGEEVGQGIVNGQEVITYGQATKEGMDGTYISIDEDSTCLQFVVMIENDESSICGVTLGMSKEEMTNLLGEPSMVEQTDSSENCIYENPLDPNDFITIKIQDDVISYMALQNCK